MILFFHCNLLLCNDFFIINKVLKLVKIFDTTFALIFITSFVVFFDARHGGVDLEELCVAVLCLCLIPDVAKALAAVSRAQDCCPLTLGPSLFLVRRSLS